ncbi:MAG: hypothetical protein ABSC94_09205 [Polyangiaceae bacterium]|jgi:hypothetical protein
MARSPFAAGLILIAAGSVACLGSGDDNGSPVPVADASLESASAQDGGAAQDACLADLSCNSCTTPATDPLNACSGFANQCVAFDAARVPPHPNL